MVRRNRDAKFIIYQVLYIFVVTVLALKGAEINLGEVVSKENVVQKSVRDSLMNVVDSLSSLGLKFNIEIDKDAVEQNIILKKKLSSLNTQVASLTNKVKTMPKIKREEVDEIEKIISDIPSPFSTSLQFLKYAINKAENKGSFNVSIVDPKTNLELVNIPPKSFKNFEIGNQSELILKYADKKELIKVNENTPPEILIEKVTNKMNKQDIYVKELQRTTCFNVVIRDERPEQIKVDYSGPIVVSGPKTNNKGDLVYNVSLKLAGSEDRYNEWIDRNEHLEDSDGRFKTNFFFTAIDKRSKQKVEVGESFYFTDFSK